MATTSEGQSSPASMKNTILLEGVTVRLAGDSGDGMQLTGTQLTNTSALLGNDVATFPDFPAEIRAPRGTRAGVSGFQVQFSSHDIFTPGDRLDALVVMNPAALVTNLDDLVAGGILIANEDGFEERDLRLAKLTSNPLDDGSLDKYRLFRVPMAKLTRAALEDLGLSAKIMDRCKNFFAMGLIYWLFGRDPDATLNFIRAKFGNRPDIAQANERALQAGWNYGETTEAFASRYRVEPARLPAGTYRNMMGNEALALGLLAAAQRSGKSLFLGSYPITPASDILHELSKYKQFGVRTFQAEDEISAICASIGAAFGGAMAVTTTSGPGLALKSEAMGLAVMLELPLLIVNVQRGGPSTGLPTKTEQADLLQVMFGRNGECPLPVLAAASPADCFDVVQEAWRIAVRFMTPVVILSDGYIANGSEPWRVPEVDEVPQVVVEHPGPLPEGATFRAYERDARLARPWAIPGTPGRMHRIGGLEKHHDTGNVSYDSDNHEVMVRLRAQKVANVAADSPLQTVAGPDRGDLLVVSWGGTYGACTTAVRQCLRQGLSVAHAHLRYLQPLPNNLGEILRNYRQVLVPELNLGQLRMLLRARYLVDAVGLNKVKGKPFDVAEVVEKIQSMLSTT